MARDAPPDTTIDTFLFDIGNVLVTFDFSRVVRFMAESSALDEPAIAAAARELIVPLETGVIDGETFLEAFAEAVEFTGDRGGMRRAFQDIFDVNGAMPDVVASLRGRYRLILFSNTSALHRDWLFAQYPVFAHFDDAIYSFATGSMKPEDGMYEHAVRTLGVDPARTVYFDDAAANIATGKRHGFRAIQYLPEQHDAALAELAKLGVDID